MTDHKAKLVGKYLAGDIADDEIRQLNQMLVNNPQAADALISEAYLDVHLRETLSGSALGAAIDKKIRPSKQTARFPIRWMAAAILLVAVSGWAMTAYVASQLGKARSNIDSLHRRVAELEEAASSTPVPEPQGEAPEIHRMRGLLMTSRNKDDTASETELLEVGKTAPLDQRLWTCPWGATEFQYNTGVSISAERNTLFELNETKGGRQLTLERGIVHVTNLSKVDKRPTKIICPLATVRLTLGQVAVQVNDQQTAVEAAIHLVKVRVDVDGVKRSFTVRQGQYLIIKPGEEPKLKQGMLKLGLNPPSA